MRKKLLSIFLLTGIFSLSSCNVANNKHSINDTTTNKDETTDQNDKNEENAENNDWILCGEDGSNLFAQIKNNKFDFYSFDLKQENKFANGGTATFNKKTKIITLKNLTPGDELKISILLKNNSQTPIKVRSKLACETNQETFDVLEKTTPDVWFPLHANEGPLYLDATSIKMPLNAPNTVQNQTITCKLIIEWVQDN